MPNLKTESLEASVRPVMGVLVSNEAAEAVHQSEYLEPQQTTSSRIIGGSLLKLKYNIPPNPIPFIKAPTLNP